MLQSRDRIHRFGLPQDTRTIYYYTLFDSDDLANNVIDKRTLDRLKIKEDRMLNAIEKEQLFVKGDSYLEDINFIFNLK